METFQFTIDEQHRDERIDKLLTEWLSDISRVRIKELIATEQITVNGKRVKASYKVRVGDDVNVRIREPEQLELKPEQIPLDILYEDAEVIIINKPRGLVVHPAPGHTKGTLVNGLLAHCETLSEMNTIRPGIVHRLDKDTSGLIMVAKTNHAHHALVKQLKEKSTTRIYKAIVHGQMTHNVGTIDAPIGRDPKNRKKMAVIETGKNAITQFSVTEKMPKHSLVECRLVTGRTHQIRVHMKYIGHPVLGDPKYGPKKSSSINGQALHAAKLSFLHPTTGEELCFTAPIPNDMAQLLESLRI